MAENDIVQRFICVCSKCNNHDTNGAIEFNFREMCIFYVCSSCKEMNKLELKALTPTPYAKGRTGLR